MKLSKNYRNFKLQKIKKVTYLWMTKEKEIEDQLLRFQEVIFVRLKIAINLMVQKDR